MSIKSALNKLKTGDLAELLEVNVRTIQRWVTEGLPRHGEGQGGYYVWAEVRAWDKARMSQARDGETDKERKLKAEVDLLELDLAREYKRLIPADEVEDAWADMGLRMRARLLALPTKAAPLVQGLAMPEVVKVLTTEVNEALQELANG